MVLYCLDFPRKMVFGIGYLLSEGSIVTLQKLLVECDGIDIPLRVHRDISDIRELVKAALISDILIFGVPADSVYRINEILKPFNIP